MQDRTFARAEVAMALGLVCAPIYAQPGGYPTKPIRVLVPFLPGGTPDIQIRMLAEKLTPRMGQQFVIDNRAGASGNIAMEIAARAPADGYTLIIGTVGNWAVNPHLFKLKRRAANVRHQGAARGGGRHGNRRRAEARAGYSQVRVCQV